MTESEDALFDRWCRPPAPDTRPGDTALADQATRGAIVISGVQGDLRDEVVTYRWEPTEPAPGRPSVVLVHGWSSRATHFAAIIRALTAAGVRCAAFDAPAHGESGGETASLPRFAAATRRLLDELREESTPPVAVVGYSFGGLAAGIACIPDLVAGPVAQVPGLVLIAAPVTLASATRRWLEMAGEPLGRSAELMRALDRRGFDGARFELLTTAHHLPDRLLLIHDAGDEEVPIADAEALLAARPDAELLRTDRFGHARILLARPVAQAVAAFATNGHGDLSRS